MPGGFTLPANLYSAFDAGFWPSGTAVNHEDLVDVVTILDSFQTPMFSSAPKIRAKDVVHSWTIDTLAATATAGVPEGVDFSGDTLTGPARLINGTQIFRRDVLVSDRERDANPAGIRDMYEHQVMKEFKVIARNGDARVHHGRRVLGGDQRSADAAGACLRHHHRCLGFGWCDHGGYRRSVAVA